MVGRMNQVLRYAGSGALFGSLFYLVLSGRMTATQYETLATTALGALGGYHAGASWPNPRPRETTDKEGE